MIERIPAETYATHVAHLDIPSWIWYDNQAWYVFHKEYNFSMCCFRLRARRQLGGSSTIDIPYSPVGRPSESLVHVMRYPPTVLTDLAHDAPVIIEMAPPAPSAETVQRSRDAEWQLHDRRFERQVRRESYTGDAARLGNFVVAGLSLLIIVLFILFVVTNTGNGAAPLFP